VVGFLGVLLMVRPGAGGHLSMGGPAVVMLVSSFLSAFSVAGMKVMTRDHSPMVLLVWSAALGLLMGIPGAFFTWRWPEPFDLLLLGAMGVLGTITQGCYIKGMSIGDAAAMAPIDYIRLVFTVIVGLTLFHEIPSVWTVAGAGIVVVSTLFITWREMQASKAAAAAVASADPA
jgi:drug/metabolite transporter (DMT)-like permease